MGGELIYQDDDPSSMDSLGKDEEIVMIFHRVL